MRVSELREYTLNYYNEHLKGNKVAINKHLKEVVFLSKTGKKIAKGGSMYKEKAAVIDHLEPLIVKSTYNNWGERKKNDSKDVIGYFNFKSKLEIDGIKRHIRIAIEVRRDKSTTLKSYDVGKKESLSSEGSVDLPSDGEDRDSPLNGVASLTISENTSFENNEKVEFNNSKILKPLGVFAPSNQAPEKKEVFRLRADNYLSDWLGELQKFRLAMILTGPTHTLKTETKNQILNALAELGMNIADLDMEQGGLESRDTQASYDRNISPQNRDRIHTTGEIPSSLEELYEWIKSYDVIALDSFNKFMTKANLKGTDFDKIRLDMPDKIWITIFQLRDDGKVRSGSSPGYDAPIIIETGKDGSDFKTAYAEIKKNRGNPDTIGLKYYPITGKIQRSENID